MAPDSQLQDFNSKHPMKKNGSEFFPSVCASLPVRPERSTDVTLA